MKKQVVTEETLTQLVLTKFIVKVLQNVNQNNFLTVGPAQDMEMKKIAILVNDFFYEK